MRVLVRCIGVAFRANTPHWVYTLKAEDGTERVEERDYLMSDGKYDMKWEPKKEDVKPIVHDIEALIWWKGRWI